MGRYGDFDWNYRPSWSSRLEPDCLRINICIFKTLILKAKQSSIAMTKNSILKGIVATLILIVAGGAIYINSLLPIITGYSAKNLCSDIFVSGREAKSIETTDLNFSFIKYTSNKVDYNARSVTSRFLWGKSKAIYREGLGATLVTDIPEEDLRKIPSLAVENPGFLPDTTAWPLGERMPDTIPAGIDKSKLDDISKKVIEENGYEGNAFAFMVLYKGVPVVEAYKPGFNPKTRFLSWSVAKSFTNGLIGSLVMDGKLDINKPAAIEAWQGDERNKITLNDLMQMQSGLKWNEDYGSRSDVNLMLFDNADMAHFAIDKPLEHSAGTFWYYSSGSANIVSEQAGRLFPDRPSFYRYMKESFLEKTGISDAVFETDPSGDFVGSSYLYATARDYARFGLLYLNDGIFNGERVLPEGWVKYTTTPASASNGEYGSLFWLNKSKKYPSAPEDMFSCQGHDGQMIFILPAQQLVVVVLGFSHKPDNELDFNSLLGEIVRAINTPV
jgi:CubicO group peptidase (beta-lactamase class C family)